MPVRAAGKIYNCAVVIQKGEIMAVVPKTYLPNYGEFYEHGHPQGGEHLQMPRGLQDGPQALFSSVQQGVLQEQVAAGIAGEAEFRQGQDFHALLCRGQTPTGIPAARRLEPVAPSRRTVPADARSKKGRALAAGDLSTMGRPLEDSGAMTYALAYDVYREPPAARARPSAASFVRAVRAAFSSPTFSSSPKFRKLSRLAEKVGVQRIRLPAWSGPAGSGDPDGRGRGGGGPGRGGGAESGGPLLLLRAAAAAQHARSSFRQEYHVTGKAGGIH